MSLGSVLGGIAKVAAPIVGGAVGGPIGAAVGGMAGQAIGKAAGGKHHKGGGGAAGAIGQVVDEAAHALGVGGGQHIDAAATARHLAAALPSDIRQQVRDVARELQSGARNREQLVRSIQQSPEIRELVGAVRLAQVQRQATDEHRGRVQVMQRQQANDARQQAMLSKLDAIIARLENRTVVPNRMARVLGGMPMLNLVARK